MHKKIVHYSALINQQLQKVTEFADVPSLYEPISYVLQGEGKRFRPVLFFTVCESLNGNIENALHAATAIEILHNFTLVHDDMMDGDELRRGRQTVHKKWDDSMAILTGDGMIALAYEEVLKSEPRWIYRLVREMTNSVRIVCEGQAMDKNLGENSQFSQNKYLEMIRRKTAELIRVSAVCGAVIADASEEQIQSAGIYAEKIGIAFQIMDDLLEIRSDAVQMGKSLGSDLTAEKKTFVLTKLCEKMPSKDFSNLLKIIRLPDIGVEERRQKFRGICEDWGVLSDGDKFVQKLTEQSLDAIRHYPTKGRKTLEELAKIIMERKK